MILIISFYTFAKALFCWQLPSAMCSFYSDDVEKVDPLIREQGEKSGNFFLPKY